jgi:hypothetical protein
MTSATTILALLPILTSTGRGSDIMIAMALPSVGGMTLVLIDDVHRSGALRVAARNRLERSAVSRRADRRRSPTFAIFGPHPSSPVKTCFDSTFLLVCAVLIAGCGDARQDDPRDPEDAFLSRLADICGRAFEGEMIHGSPSDTAFAGQRMVMHVRECRDGEVRIPFPRRRGPFAHVDRDAHRRGTTSQARPST